MKLLSRFYNHGGKPHTQLVALFGMGLIGSQVLKKLIRSETWKVQTLPYDWNNSEIRKVQLVDLKSTIKANLSIIPEGERQLDLVWCAGKAGFSAKQSTFDAEHTTFVETFEACSDLIKHYEFGTAKCHLVSSAGGLFEGQTLVGQHSIPRPLRPYGKAKINLETYITNSKRGFSPYIYRPSSVYGYNKPGSRIGLIVALLGNSIRNKESVIFGRPSTLRDFVFADDIGNFMGHKIMAPDAKPGVFNLAAGKPTSMVEIIGLIQSLEQKNLLLRYTVGDSNVRDNTFNASNLPSGWHPTPLEIGINQVSRRMKIQFHSHQM